MRRSEKTNDRTLKVADLHEELNDARIKSGSEADEWYQKIVDLNVGGSEEVRLLLHLAANVFPAFSSSEGTSNLTPYSRAESTKLDKMRGYLAVIDKVFAVIDKVSEQINQTCSQQLAKHLSDQINIMRSKAALCAAQFYYESEKFSECIVAAKQVGQKHKFSAKIYHGLALEREGKVLEAIEIYKQALETDPEINEYLRGVNFLIRAHQKTDNVTASTELYSVTTARWIGAAITKESQAYAKCIASKAKIENTYAVTLDRVNQRGFSEEAGKMFQIAMNSIIAAIVANMAHDKENDEDIWLTFIRIASGREHLIITSFDKKMKNYEGIRNTVKMRGEFHNLCRRRLEVCHGPREETKGLADGTTPHEMQLWDHLEGKISPLLSQPPPSVAAERKASAAAAETAAAAGGTARELDLVLVRQTVKHAELAEAEVAAAERKAPAAAKRKASAAAAPAAPAAAEAPATAAEAAAEAPATAAEAAAEAPAEAAETAAAEAAKKAEAAETAAADAVKKAAADAAAEAANTAAAGEAPAAEAAAEAPAEATAAEAAAGAANTAAAGAGEAPAAAAKAAAVGRGRPVASGNKWKSKKNKSGRKTPHHPRNMPAIAKPNNMWGMAHFMYPLLSGSVLLAIYIVGKHQEASGVNSTDIFNSTSICNSTDICDAMATGIEATNLSLFP